MIQSFKKNIVTSVVLLLSVCASAQSTLVAAPVSSASTSNNLVLYLLIAACAVMLVAVLILGNVMVDLTKIVINKRSAKTIAVVVLMICSNFIFAQDAAVATSTSFKFSTSFNVLVGILVFIIEFGVVIWMLLSIRSLLAEIIDEKKEVKTFTFQMPKLFNNINASVAIEKEQDILLDHDYDGIKELDNSLPPWWKYSFYLSIIWSIGYLGYYYIGNGPSTIDEYNTEVQLAQIEVEEYNKKNALNVDENNVKYADVAGIADGMQIYKTSCVACHGALGEGGVGPNLTDKYWVHGATANDLFKTVKYGWPANGMKSWASDLSAVQIKNVISYIHTMEGTNPPNAKAAQGILIGASIAVIDSATRVIDSSNVVAK